jgi:hypothetical protein
MTSQRTIRLTAAMAAVALSVCAPSAAQASSLLSGYGGPGQGNQAILGSGLLNTPSGGGGSGGGSVSSTSAGSVAAQGGSAAGKRAHKGGAASGKQGSRSKAGSSAASPLYLSPGQLQRSRAASTGTSVLGLSGEQLLLTILGLVALVLIGAFTLRLARDGRQPGTGPKEIRPGTRVTE